MTQSDRRASLSLQLLKMRPYSAMAFEVSLVLSALFFLRTEAFVPLLGRSYLTRASSLSPSSLHYFDDVSRYSLEWNAPDSENEARFQAQKMEALKFYVLGHDAISASKLTKQEVKRWTKGWARRNAVVRDPSNVEESVLYDKLSGMTVCRNSDMLGCLAYYWRRIVKVMREDEQNTENRSSFVNMMVFPYCKDLYVYEKFQLLNMAIALGSPAEFSLTIFHPKYKNAPAIFSPERHAPFPTAGLVRKKPKDDDFLDDSVFLDRQRVSLERLFNSAAARTTEESSSSDFDTLLHERLYLPAHQVVEMSQVWFDTTTKQTDDDQWFVSDATITEEAYADVFTAIHDLYLLGLDTPKGETRSTIVVTPRYCPFNAPQWRHFCITINAILKKMGKRKMNVEFYHPEYSEDAARLSPFSTIQIVYKA